MPNKPIDLTFNLQSRRTDAVAADGVVVEAGLYNCYVEDTAQGHAVVKRPGVAVFQRGSAGFGQGIFGVGTQVWKLTADVLYRVDGTSPSVALPGVTVSNQEFRFFSNTDTMQSLIQSPTGLWVFDGTTATKVTSANYPAATVPGVVMLDQTVYVLSTDGIIHGSALGDPFTWDALNFIALDQGLGLPRNLHRHLNYVTAVCETGVQMFYDAANATGSPLSPVDNASWKMGAVANSITRVVDDTYMLVETTATSKAGGYQVVQISGLQPQVISTPHVDRLLSSANVSPTVYSYGCQACGHTFFVLTLYELGVTAVYDATMKFWYLWDSIADVYGSRTFAEIRYYRGYLQNISDGTVKVFSENQFVDQAGFATSSTFVLNTIAINAPVNSPTTPGTYPIMVQVLIPPVDFATLRRKFLPVLYLLADSAASTVSISWSDDDGQTYSTPRTVDLSQARKMLTRCGSSRRRSWKITHSDATALRLYKMELEVEGGAE